jgi:7-cyano-7-deazaguanine reductase
MLERSHLGVKSVYVNSYNPKLLYPIPRAIKRDELGIAGNEFYGVDIWNHYEISWLNVGGKPAVAIGEIIYPSNSPNIIESKSMKLYFNSFNGTVFENSQQLIDTVLKDLSSAVGEEVTFNLIPLDSNISFTKFSGICLDRLNVVCDTYKPYPDYLKVSDIIVEEELYSNLLKSNCLVTSQPDWGSVYINYTGHQISHEGLLKYIVSLREHNEFHEQCVERIFHDIMKYCKPTSLIVYARYTRRGGVDINPYRTTNKSFIIPSNNRLIRQ